MKKIFLLILFFYTNVYSNTIDINYYKELYNNSDIISYLYITDVISIPLVKTTNNTYYLDHDLYKNYDKRGTTFLDYRSNIDKTIIYGHNSEVYDVVFKCIEKYLDKEFMLSHKEIYIYSTELLLYIIDDVVIVNETNYEEIINKYDLVLQTCYKDEYILIGAYKS